MGTWIKRRRTKYVINHEVESMDHILEGVLASSHPEAMKLQLIDKISQKGQDQQSPGEVRAVLSLAFNWVLQGNSELQVSSGFKLFSSWAKHHPEALESFLTRDLLTNLLTKPSRNQANLPLLLTEALKQLQSQGNTKLFLQHLKVLSAKAPAFLQDGQDVGCVKSFLQMLLQFQDSLPKGDLASRLALPLMHILATCNIPADSQQVFQFIMDVSSLTELLQEIWKHSTVGLLLDCLRELFKIISAEDGPEPSVCLASLVRLIPQEVMESAIKSAVTDTRISDGAVNAALRRMIDWLVWPTCKSIDQWIVCFLKELAAAKKYSILISITESKSEQVLDKVRFAPVREASFNILSHMLLSFQHSPQPFHKALQKVPEVLALLEKEGTEESLRWRTKLAELLHCLMYLHTGFPDLYDPILDLIKDVPCPSSEDISSRLSERRWSTQHSKSSVSSSSSSSLAVKSDTGKTGLFNLGNTCYMNSILQTLFMCDDFRRQALTHTPTPEEGLLDKLQHVFASLLLSQRPAVAPMKFLAASRPPWFIPGQQQDCSEFLKYLLDQVHEQQLQANKKQAKAAASPARSAKKQGSKGNEGEAEVLMKGQTCDGDGGGGGGGGGSGGAKEQSTSEDAGKDRTLVRESFGGKMRLTSRCLSCHQESHRVEDFTDISLAFPRAGADGTSASLSLKSLVGGGSHLPQNHVTKPQECVAGSLKVAPPPPQPPTDSPSRATHLNELLSHYLSPERLEGDNQYRCERCGKLQDGERTITIVECPQYLILTLLRFDYDTKTQTRSKVFREVTCPRTLALPVQGQGTAEGATNSSTVAKRRKKLLHHLHPKLPPSVSSCPGNCELYGLCSVVVHSGASSECGHYYCFSRHSQVGDIDAVIDSLDRCAAAAASTTKDAPDQPTEEEVDVDFLQDRWCLFNDARVSGVSFSSFRNLAQRFQKDTPYVLVYKKLSLDSHDAQGEAEPPLSQSLHDAVSKDNTQYLKEQELAAKARASRKCSPPSSTTTFHNWFDPDSDQGPPGSCGGGGGGGLDNSGPRFVF